MSNDETIPTVVVCVLMISFLVVGLWYFFTGKPFYDTPPPHVRAYIHESNRSTDFQEPTGVTLTPEKYLYKKVQYFEGSQDDKQYAAVEVARQEKAGYRLWKTISMPPRYFLEGATITLYLRKERL